jgi:hypothetical protein
MLYQLSYPARYINSFDVGDLCGGSPVKKKSVPSGEVGYAKLTAEFIRKGRMCLFF